MAQDSALTGTDIPYTITGTAPLALTSSDVLSLEELTGTNLVSEVWADNMLQVKTDEGILEINVSDSTFTYKSTNPVATFDSDKNVLFTVNVKTTDGVLRGLLDYTFNFVMASE